MSNDTTLAVVSDASDASDASGTSLKTIDPSKIAPGTMILHKTEMAADYAAITFVGDLHKGGRTPSVTLSADDVKKELRKALRSNFAAYLRGDDPMAKRR